MQTQMMMKKQKQLSFLPEPLYSPKCPTEELTLAQKALAMLLTSNHISHPQFEGSNRLLETYGTHAYLKRLRWPVKTESMGMGAGEDEMRTTGRTILYYLPDDLLDMMKGVQNLSGIVSLCNP